MNELWRSVLQDGLLPVMTSDQIRCVLACLLHNDGRLIQGATTSPPPLKAVASDPVERACLVGMAVWQLQDGFTVGETDKGYVRLLGQTDRLYEKHHSNHQASRWFLSWFDDTSRDEMRAELIPELKAELERRHEHRTCTISREPQTCPV